MAVVAVDPKARAYVLLIGSDARMLAATRRLFEARRERYAVLAARTSERALALVARHRPVAALFDLGAAFELIPRIKYLATDIACIATNPTRDAGALDRALRCGADDLLRSPVDPNTLHQALERYREGRRYVRERAEGERRLRAVVEQTYQSLFLVSASGELLHANQTACGEIGVESGEITGRAIWETPWWSASPDLQRRLKGWLARAYGGETVRAEFQTPFPDGEPRHIEASIKAVQDDGGRLDFIMLECRDNTERERLERDRRRLAAIVEATPDIVGMADRDDQVFFLNAAGRRLLGDTGRAFAAYYPERAVAQIAAEALPAAGRDGSWSGETTLRARDGREIPVSLVVLAHRAASGEIEYYSGIARDISQRVLAEQRLRRSEADLAMAQRIARLGNWEWDLVSGGSRMSDEAFRILGLTQEENAVTYERFLGCVHPGDRAAVAQATSDALSRVAPYAMDYRVVRDDGSEITVHSEARVVTGADGVPAGMVGTLQDITERKLLERALQEANEDLERRVAERTRTLRESEERFRQLAENIQEVFWVSSADGNELFFMSPAYEHVWGRERAEIYRDPWVWLEAVHPEDRPRVERAFRKADPGSVRDEVYRIFRPDGEMRWVRDRAFPLRDAAGKVFRITGIATDITAQMEAREAIERSREELRQFALHQETHREQLRRSIARELHDEIGQSTLALKMDLHWLEKHLPVADGEMRRRIAGMQSVIECTVAAVHRIVAELRPMMLDDLGLESTLNWYLDEFEKRTGITCRRELSVAELPLDDRVTTACYRIAQEALANAARHAGATLVYFTLRIDERSAFLEISDNGRGIAKEEMAKSGSFGILGMRERVGALRGTLRIDGRAGAGTTVRISLPLH